jgi:hypothetical protein
LKDGSSYRYLNPQEQDTMAQHQARQNAKAAHQTALEQVKASLQIPEMAERAKNDPNFASDLYSKALNNYVPPATTQAQAQAQLLQKIQNAQASGDTSQADALRADLMASRPGAAQAHLSPPALAAAAKRYVFTGQMPPSIGRNGIESAEIQDAAYRLYPNENVAQNQVLFDANKKSMSAQIPLYDAISQYERTAGDNINIAKSYLSAIPNMGSPIWNTPLRAISEKALGDADLPAYNAASQVVANEVARITSMASQNPGVLAQKSLDDIKTLISSKDATPAQILKTYGVLMQDMSNRRAESGQQIQNIMQRTGASANDIRDWFGSETPAQTPGTTNSEGKTEPSRSVAAAGGATAPPKTDNPANKKYAATDTDTRTGNAVGSDDNWKTIYEIRSGKKLQ